MGRGTRISQPDWAQFWKVVLATPLGRLKWKLATRYWVRTCKHLLRGLKIRTCLELGAGSGYLSQLLARELGFSITLVDNDPQAKAVWEKSRA